MINRLAASSSFAAAAQARDRPLQSLVARISEFCEFCANVCTGNIRRYVRIIASFLIGLLQWLDGEPCFTQGGFGIRGAAFQVAPLDFQSFLGKLERFGLTFEFFRPGRSVTLQRFE